MAKHFSVPSPTLKVALYLFLLTINLKYANSIEFVPGTAEGLETPEDIPTAPAAAPAVEAAGSPTIANDDHTHPPLTFFMHDILGGSTPSTRMVTGIAANTGVNGQLPFSKPHGGVFPVNGGVPLLNGNINNNMPIVTELGNANSNPNTMIQNSGNNNVVNGGNRLPFVTGGQVPAGSTLQKVMFGSITVVDDELTEGHELGSSVLGKVQGFYLASSQDGSSQTMALTALLHGSGGEADHDFDTISFFGIHRTAAPMSHVAIVGGTGKYGNVRGYGTIETLHDQVDQHTTDGVETILKISVYLTS